MGMIERRSYSSKECREIRSEGKACSRAYEA
jgi:hypothetical protein